MSRSKLTALGLLPLLLAGLSSTGSAGAAAAPKATIAITGQSASSVYARGGSITFTGTVANASSCVLSSVPATTTVTTNCNHLPTFTAPVNASTKAVSYKVTITATGTSKATASAIVTQAAATIVDMWGDSMLYQGGPFTQAAIEAANPNVVTYIHAFPGTDICFWNEPTRADGIPALLKAHKPAVVIIQMRGEGAAKCAKKGDPTVNDYSAKGLAQVTTSYEAVIAELTKAKVGYGLVVPMPVRRVLPSYAADDVNMRQAIAAAVTAAGGATVHYLDASPALTGANGAYTDTLPCTADEIATPGHCTGPVVGGVPMNVVRADDGVHLCNVTWGTTTWPPYGCPGYSYSPGGTRMGSFLAAPINVFLAG